MNTEDKQENIEYIVFSSTLHLFKNMKAGLKSCTSFSKSKALYDLQVAFKNVIRHYMNLLKKKLPAKSWQVGAMVENKKIGAPM